MVRNYITALSNDEAASDAGRSKIRSDERKENRAYEKLRRLLRHEISCGENLSSFQGTPIFGFSFGAVSKFSFVESLLSDTMPNG
jgi:hypothetical protein